MDENAVVDAVCRRLLAQGCKVVQRLSTIEQGVDIIAEDPKTGRRFLIEAKGGTSSREGSARFGKPYTQTQVFDRVAKGVFTCVQLRAQYPEKSKQQVVLAVPDERWFRSYLEPVIPELRKAGIDVWFEPATDSATSRAPQPAETSGAAAATASVSTDSWRAILRVDHAPPIGELLACHPEAIALTRRLLTSLTVERLIAIADALHNKCRVSDLKATAPGDPQRQSELAWAALLHGAEKTHERPSGWTGCAKLLNVGHLNGVAAVAKLEIGSVAGVCSRIVSGPYRQANASGLR